ncbi:restriction endonuclease subunit S [Lactococcus sp. LG606]|uniref:restriction endonuclease subunit S n=1 Tax=Lactococcus sp. LG606 TaxID=2816912 RepID=UPI001A901DC2|nr:restriction endonuclease subunit S [Lactococcus sp. LG606]QSR13327.1 restriction endonuclease subunit S [Lactococcus sp. LG606]
MSENVKKEPDIRFEGFVDDWEERKFDDSFSFPVSTNSLSRAMLNYDSGEVKSIHYGDILIKYPSILDIRREEIPFITSGTLEKYKENILVNGDLIFADAAEDETVGKAVEIHGITDEYIVSGLHTIVARASQQNAKYFLGYYINSDNYHRQLLRLIQGSKVSAISKGNLQKTQVTFPKEYEEQLKIGYFFKQLDNTITLHQQKLELLKKTKKGYLQKMFPKNGETVPEIRFEGFSGEWEFKPLGDLVKISSGFTGDSLLDNGKYHLTRIETIAKGVIDESRVGYSNIQPPDRFLLNNGDILFSNINSLAHIGKTAIYDKGKELYHGINLLRLTPNNFMNPYFLYYQLNSEKKLRWAKSHANQAVNQASINQTELSKQIFMIPNTSEQDKIGMFLINLDHLIKYQQKRLDNLKYLKKSLLQKMFI